MSVTALRPAAPGRDLRRKLRLVVPALADAGDRLIAHEDVR